MLNPIILEKAFTIASWERVKISERLANVQFHFSVDPPKKHNQCWGLKPERHIAETPFPCGTVHSSQTYFAVARLCFEHSGLETGGSEKFNQEMVFPPMAIQKWPNLLK